MQQQCVVSPPCFARRLPSSPVHPLLPCWCVCSSDPRVRFGSSDKLKSTSRATRVILGAAKESEGRNERAAGLDWCGCCGEL